MPSPSLVATLTTQSDIGRADPETGRTWPPLLLTNDVILPTSIDTTFTTEVTADIQAFIDATPDGSRIRFQPGARYYTDLQVTLKGRKRIKIDGQGATLQMKHKFPLLYHLTGIGISEPGHTGPYTVPGWGAPTAITAPSNGASLPTGTINVVTTGAYPSSGTIIIVGPPGAGVETTVTYTGRTPGSFTGCTGGTGTLATGQTVLRPDQAIYVQPGTLPTLGGYNNDQVADDTVAAPGQDNIPIITFIRSPVKSTGYRLAQIASKSFIPCVPGEGLSVIILGPNSAIARIALHTDDAGNRCQHNKISNLNLVGTNDGQHPPPGQTGHLPAGSYDTQVEGQHGIDAKGADGTEIGPNVNVAYVWGDNLNLTVDNPAGPGTHLDPRPGGLAGGNACRDTYLHDAELHHNGRMGITATGVIGFLYDRIYLHDCPRSGLDTEVPTSSVCRDVTGRSSRMLNIRFGWVNFASYPIKNNAYIDNCTFDGLILDGLANIINNPAPATQRWTNIRFRNLDASGGPIFGRSTPRCVVEVLGVDGFEMVGCKQALQIGGPALFLVSAAQSRAIDVHDNPISCGPAWVLGTHYTNPSPLSQVTHLGDAYYCRSTHTASSVNEPGVGASWPTFWGSQQLAVDSFPVLSARLVTESDLGVVAMTAVPSAAARLTASLTTESDLGVTMNTIARLSAQVSTQSDLRATLTAVRPATILVASFVTETRIAARLRSPRAGVPDNEFRLGHIAATGAGWDEEPDGWDSQPFGGTG